MHQWRGPGSQHRLPAVCLSGRDEHCRGERVRHTVFRRELPPARGCARQPHFGRQRRRRSGKRRRVHRRHAPGPGRHRRRRSDRSRRTAARPRSARWSLGTQRRHRDAADQRQCRRAGRARRPDQSGQAHRLRGHRQLWPGRGRCLALHRADRALAARPAWRRAGRVRGLAAPTRARRLGYQRTADHRRQQPHRPGAAADDCLRRQRDAGRSARRSGLRRLRLVRRGGRHQHRRGAADPGQRQRADRLARPRGRFGLYAAQQRRVAWLHRCRRRAGCRGQPDAAASRSQPVRRRRHRLRGCRRCVPGRLHDRQCRRPGRAHAAQRRRRHRHRWACGGAERLWPRRGCRRPGPHERA